MTMNTAPSPGQPRGAPGGGAAGGRGLQPRRRPVRVPRPDHARRASSPWTPSKLLTSRRTRSGDRRTARTARRRSPRPTPPTTSTASGAAAVAASTARPGRRSSGRPSASTHHQGWAGFPDVSADPDQLGCDYFTQIDVTGAVHPRRPDRGRGPPRDDASGRGAADCTGGLPLGTGLDCRHCHIRGRARRPRPRSTVDLTAPRSRHLPHASLGVEPARRLDRSTATARRGRCGAGDTVTATFERHARRLTPRPTRACSAIGRPPVERPSRPQRHSSSRWCRQCRAPSSCCLRSPSFRAWAAGNGVPAAARASSSRCSPCRPAARATSGRRSQQRRPPPRLAR